MSKQLDAREQVLSLLARGWQWRDAFSDVLVHPTDHSLSVTYDRVADTLSMSVGLVAALELVIPTANGQSRRYWRDDQKADLARLSRR